jgi:hypothetical protein
LRLAVLLLVLVAIVVLQNFAHGSSIPKPEPFYCTSSCRCTAS